MYKVFNTVHNFDHNALLTIVFSLNYCAIVHCFDRCVRVLMTTSVHFAVLIILHFLPQRIVLTTVHCVDHCALFWPVCALCFDSVRGRKRRNGHRQSQITGSCCLTRICNRIIINQPPKYTCQICLD